MYCSVQRCTMLQCAVLWCAVQYSSKSAVLYCVVAGSIWVVLTLDMRRSIPNLNALVPVFFNCCVQWEEMGLKYPLEGMEPPPKEQLEHWKQYIQSEGIKVML